MNPSVLFYVVDIKLALCKNDLSNAVQAGNTLLISHFQATIMPVDMALQL